MRRQAGAVDRPDDRFRARRPRAEDQPVKLQSIERAAVDASSPKDLHFYEPKNGHGLKHDPFNAIIAPRPIGWISSRDADGNVNLAPYSFFNAFCYVPPIIGFSSTNWKDSAGNIKDAGEFVWNLATMDLAKQIDR